LTNLIIGVRVTPRIRKMLDEVCKLRGEDISDFVRRAILKELAQLDYLSDLEKKALGVSTLGG